VDSLDAASAFVRKWGIAEVYKRRKYMAIASGEAPLKAAIAQYGAVYISMDVYTNFMSYISGVYAAKVGRRRGGHAMQAIGWGALEDGTKYWIIENSWGNSWGETMAFEPCATQLCSGDYCADGGASSSSSSTPTAPQQNTDAHGYLRSTCGYMRVLRGTNLCGIEEGAMYTIYDGARAPSAGTGWQESPLTMDGPATCTATTAAGGQITAPTWAFAPTPPPTQPGATDRGDGGTTLRWSAPSGRAVTSTVLAVGPGWVQELATLPSSSCETQGTIAVRLTPQHKGVTAYVIRETSASSEGVTKDAFTLPLAVKASFAPPKVAVSMDICHVRSAQADAARARAEWLMQVSVPLPAVGDRSSSKIVVVATVKAEGERPKCLAAAERNAHEAAEKAKLAEHMNEALHARRRRLDSSFRVETIDLAQVDAESNGDTECYTLPNGEDYRGTVAATRGGLECLPWTQREKAYDGPGLWTGSPGAAMRGLGVHNYCRNPDGAFEPEVARIVLPLALT